MSNTDQAEPDVLTAEALASLDIKKQPFDSKADHFRLYTDDLIQDLLNQIHTILGNSDHLPVIMGAAGSGKSSLLSLLISRTNDAVQYFVVEGNEYFNAYNVFAGMLEAFQIPAPEDLQACLDELSIQLHALEEQKLQAVILIDDAHGVNPSELYKLISGMLYMRDGSDLKSFRIALTAKPEFEERLAKIIPNGTELHYTTLALPKLDGERTGRFISHHLKQAGFFEPLPLDNTQIQDIRRTSNGLPRNTCMEAVRTFNALYKTNSPSTMTSSNSFTAPINWVNDKKLLGVIAGALILVSVFLFTGNDPEPEMINQTTADAGNMIVSSEPLKLDNNQLSAKNENGTPRLVLLSEVDGNKPPGVQSEEQTPEAPKPLASPAQKLEVQTKPIVQPKPEPEPSESPEKKPEPAPTIVKTPEPVKPAPKPAIPEKQASVVVNEEQPEDDPIEVTVVTESDDSELETEQSNLQSPNWVLMQDPQQFTVQVIASSDKREVERFLAIHKLNDPNSIFSFKRGDETWYSLVHGLFVSIEDAQESIKELPDAVQAKHPWIRKIRRIHDSLKTSN